MKIRFLEPGNRPYKPTPLNYFVYDRYIRTPSVGLNTLATIVKELVGLLGDRCSVFAGDEYLFILVEDRKRLGDFCV